MGGSSPQEVTPDKLAKSLMQTIEKRTAYMLSQSHIALEIFLTKRAAQDSSTSTQNLSLQNLQPNAKSVQLADLEQYAPLWRHLVPDSADIQAALAHRLHEKYNLSEQRLPLIRDALKLDSTKVREAYERLFNETLTEILSSTVITQVGDRERSSRNILTSSLGVSETEAGLEWIQLKRGQTLFKQGDVGDSLYVVITGRLRLVVKAEDGKEILVREQGRGQLIGEMAVLSQETRSGTVYAVRDSELLKLSQSNFDQLVENQPKVMMNITRTLTERLRDTLQGRQHVQEISNVVLLPLNEGVPLPDFAGRLVKALSIYGLPLHLSSERLDSYFGEGVLTMLESAEDRKRIIDLLDEQETRYRFVIYECDPTLTEWTRLCLHQADRVLLVGNAGDDPALSKTEKYLIQRSDPTADVERELVLLYPDRSHAPRHTGTWFAGRILKRHYHVALKGDADIQRLARRLVGRAVGLALGAGGAKGFGHIGVINALEEAGIPIDVIGGTSAGSIMSALYAAGYRGEEFYKAALSILDDVRDPTLPMLSWWRTHKFDQRLISIFGKRQIEDLWLEYFAISSNLTQARRMVHREGLLWRYVKASCSLPGIFPPVLDNGDLLVDGGIFDMVPTDVMAELCEGSPVIGVELTEGVALARDYDFATDQSGWALLANRMNPFAKKKLKAPSIVELLTHTSMISVDEQRTTNRRHASLYISLPLREITVFDTGKAEKAMEIGYETAKAKIAEWKAKGYKV